MAVQTQGIVPGGSEVIRLDNGSMFLSYVVPNTNPPVRMFWHIATDDQIKALFGPDGWQASEIDRTMSVDQFHVESAGRALYFGTVAELVNKSDHPFESFLADYEKEAEIRPWLRDSEMLALHAMAILEGRTPTEAELKTTSWWQSRTEAQRQWIASSAADPATARQTLDANRRKVFDLIRELGAEGVPQSVIDFIADQGTRGDWDASYVDQQLRRLTDPAAPYALDAAIQSRLSGTAIETTRDREENVRRLAAQWLGPLYGNFSQDDLSRWAGRLRNDPNGEVEFLDHLRGQRLALFPEYDNPNLTYEDIAGPARTLFSQVWGQVADEKDPFFISTVRNRDIETATAGLRNEGLKRGIDRVVNDALSASSNIFAAGVNVRRAL